MVFAFTFPLLFFVITKDNWKWYNKATVFLVAIASILPLVIMLGSRSGFIIIMLVTVSFVIFQIKTKFYVKVFLIGCCLFAVYFLIRGNLYNYDDYIRKSILTATSDNIEKYPLTGIGFEKIQIPAYRDSAMTEFANYFSHSHNQFLEEIMRFGIFGGIPFLFLILYVIFLSLYKKPDYKLFFWLMICVPVSMIDLVFHWGESAIPFCFWLCFIVSQKNKKLLLNI
jgi:O-antigen ligase